MAPPADGIRGGVQSVTTVDRLNPASATGTPFGAAPATPPIGSQIGQDFNAFVVRSQYSF